MVGRILYLKSNHIIPCAIDIKSQYISFGNYDGISISENVFSNDDINLLKIWIQSVKDTIKMEGGYSSQAIYLFNDDNVITDKEFWEDNYLQFLFLIAIQLNKRNGNLDNVCCKIKQKIYEYCKKNKINVKITAYFMLDQNDILLAIKCNNYRLGKIVTSSFHKENNGIVYENETFYVSYSFTITAIKKRLKNYSQCDVPDCCEIQVIERYPGSINQFNISGEIYPVFGRDDYLLRYCPESWEKILDLYKENGLFNNQTSKKRLLSVLTQFLCRINESEKIQFGNGQIKEDIDDDTIITIAAQLRDKVKNLYNRSINELVENYDSYDNALLYSSNACYKAIWQILNSIEKYEYKAFPDYIYIALFGPISMLISKISNEKCLNNISGIYSLLTAINQISQNVIRAERQFMQLPELNANCYNIPIKLHLYYAAFVDQAKSYLNETFGTGNSYEFILYPGINEQLVVNRVFYSSGDHSRMLLMKIPEKQVFDPEHMMICLCHEVGHFVGSKLRRREARYDTLKDAIARAICLHLYCDEKIAHYITKEGLDYLLRVMQREIVNCIDTEKEIFEKSTNNYCDTVLHSENLRPIILQGISKFIADNLNRNNNIFDSVLADYIKEYDFSELNSNLVPLYLKYIKNDYNKSIRSFFYKIQVYTDSNKHKISVYNIVERLFLLLRESFADLVSILVLDLDFKSYCQAIFKSFTEYKIKEIVNSDIIIRVILVTMAMSLPLEDNETKKIYKEEWQKEQIIEWEQKEKNIHIKDFLTVILEYYNYASYNYEKGDSAYERLRDIRSDSVISVFRDYELLHYLYVNLANCRLYFKKNSNEVSENKRVKIKHNFKMLIGDYMISEKIKHINNVNDEYDFLTRNRVRRYLY